MANTGFLFEDATIDGIETIYSEPEDVITEETV